VRDWFDNCLLMSKSGRKRTASAAQCAKVRRLAAEGESVRQIAREVFGDQRFRGRVERILQAPVAANNSPEDTVVIGEATVAVETVPAVRAALARYLARVATGEVNPSVGEMVKLLDLERRLQAIEALEEINAITRTLES
jgi:hypothetical protein